MADLSHISIDGTKPDGAYVADGSGDNNVKSLQSMTETSVRQSLRSGVDDAFGFAQISLGGILDGIGNVLLAASGVGGAVVGAAFQFILDGATALLDGIANALRGNGLTPELVDIGAAMEEKLEPISEEVGKALKDADEALTRAGQLNTDLDEARRTLDEKAAKAIRDAEAAQRTADTANRRGKDINAALTGQVDGDLADAVAAHEGIVGKIAARSEEFGQWSEENQQELNTAFFLAHDYTKQALGENQLAWQGQADLNKQLLDTDEALLKASKANTTAIRLAFPHMNLIPGEGPSQPWLANLSGQRAYQPKDGETGNIHDGEPVVYGQVYDLMVQAVDDELAYVGIDPDFDYKLSFWVRNTSLERVQWGLTFVDENGQMAAARSSFLDEDIEWESTSGWVAEPAKVGSEWWHVEYVVTFKPGVERVRIGQIGVSEGSAGIMTNPHLSAYFPLQEDVNRALAEGIEANQTAAEAIERSQNVLEQEATRMLWADREQAVKNKDIKLSNPKFARDTVIECFGDWEGVVVLHTIRRYAHPVGLVQAINVDQAWQRFYRVTKTNRRFTFDNGVGPDVMHSTIFYQKWSPGTEQEVTDNNA